MAEAVVKRAIEVTFDPRKVDSDCRARIGQKLRWLFGDDVNITWVRTPRFAFGLLIEGVWTREVEKIVHDERKHGYQSPFDENGHILPGRLDVQELPHYG